MPSASSASTTKERDAAIKRQTLQNRLNQREFRSRRQEYVRELEEQVRRFQQEGVQVTKEVQIAARSVALENSLLRKLFKAYAHCNDDDMDMLLVHAGGENSAVQCNHGKSTAENQLEGTQVKLLPDTPSTSSTQTFVRWEPAKISKASITSTTSVATTPRAMHDVSVPKATHHLPFATIDATSSFSTHVEANPFMSSTVTESAMLHQNPSQNLTNLSRVPPPRKNPQDSISCEEAAAIIAGLRLQHSDEVREELGCTSQVSCNVKNMVLLQLMNDMF